MKQISKSDAAKLLNQPTENLRKSPCLEITSNGLHVGFLVIGSEGAMRDKIQGLSSQIDAGRGV